MGFDLSSASGSELAFDERARAEALSAEFRTEQYEMILKSGDMERCLDGLVWAIEEPRVGQSYPNFFAAKLASSFVKVVMSGVGGDELFGGYPWRYFRGANARSFEEYVDSYYRYWQRLVSNSEIKALFAPVWSEVKDVWTRDIFRDVFSNHPNVLERPEDFINHSLYFEAKTFLHGLLVVEDKISMAHGLEARVPFLDNDLVDFSMGMPVGLKLRNIGSELRLDENDYSAKTSERFGGDRDGKLILREAMASLVPAHVLNREKQGFSSPDASWFRGASREFVKKSLSAGGATATRFLDLGVANDLLDEHFEGKKNRRLLVWALLSLGYWNKLWLPRRR